MINTVRIASLDYAKGILALCIMFYHYTLWMNISPDLSQPLTRISVYGVSAFFVMSGLTNYLAHAKTINLKPKVLYAFYKKRFLRIMSLYWVIITLMIFINFKKQYNWEDLFLNYTSLFGFLKPSHYIATGGWFIGNIMVYYAFFPFIVYLLHTRKKLFIILLVTSLSWCMYASFFLMTNQKALSEQWEIYINPFTNLFFFIGGIFIATLKPYQNIINPRFLCAGIITIIFLFFFIPLNGNPIHCIYGSFRLVYILLTVSFCTLLYLLNFRLKASYHKLLLFLHRISYSIYLWHPVTFILISGVNKITRLNLSINTVLSIALICTIPLCYLSAKFIESRFSRFNE